MRRLGGAGAAGSGLLIGLFLCGAVLLGAACEDPSSTAGGGGFEAGAQFDAPANDTSTTNPDGSPQTDGNAPDASGDGGAPVLGPVACGAPQTLAGLPGGNASASGLRAAALPGGRMIVVWNDQVTVGQLTPSYRLFDGATWGAAVAFANQGQVQEFAVDGLGNAYLTYQVTAQSKISRAVLAAGAAAFGAEQLVDIDGQEPRPRLGALASGSVLLYRAAGAYLASRYDVGAATWGAPVTVATFPGFALGRVGTGTTNKAAAVWLDVAGVHVRTFDGATWAAPVDDPDAPVAPTSDQPNAVTASNGDAYVTWRESGATTKLRGHRYHVATQTWDAVETIYDGNPAGDLRVELRVDAADHLTAAFEGQLPAKALGAVVARNVGAGWSSTALDGFNSSPTLDRFGNVYAMTSSLSVNQALLNRAGVAGTTWLPSTPTGLSPVGDPFECAAVALDGASHANVFALSGGSLKVVVCK
jgi:hypothetical protein